MKKFAKRLQDILNEQDFCFDPQEMRDVERSLGRLAAYEGTELEPEEVKDILERYRGFRTAISDETGQPMVSWTRASELVRADKEGLAVILPCKVGSTVYLISKCQNVQMSRDDDYFDGTGAMECPFESYCDTEDCNDEHIRIFETILSDFWYGEENEKRPEMFFEHIGGGYRLSDFGKTVFLTRAEAEAAIGGGGDG